MKNMFRFSWLLSTMIYRFFFKKIGWLSYVAPAAYICGGRKISIGDRVRIMPGSRLECHENGELQIYDNVSIGNGCHIAAGGRLVINSGTLISSFVLITDIDHELSNPYLSPLKTGCKNSKTEIGINVFIGTGAKVLAGSRIGDNCVIAANAVVRGCFPARVVIAGVPAKIIRRYDEEVGRWIRVY